jgi:ADP-heptose:LPS heptosyltransferase
MSQRTPYRRIAVCIADFANLGDHLALLPLYDGLQRTFPGSRLWVASRFERVELAEQYGFVDETVLYRSAGVGLLRRVRRFDPDLSICLRRRSVRANFCFGRASGAERTVGFPGLGTRWMHTQLAEYRERGYRPFRYLAALEALGGRGDLRSSVRRLAAGSSWRPSREPYAVLVPGGAKEEKQWGAGRFARVAARLSGDHPEIHWYTMLGPRELERGDAELLRDVPQRHEVLEAPPIDELARIFLGARLVLANDCGPGNLAQMSGVPLVQPFGNWDGAAAERIGWWFDPRPGAVCLTTRSPAPIDAIAESEVESAARELLHDPRAGGQARLVGD